MAGRGAFELEVPFLFLEFEIYGYVFAATLHTEVPADLRRRFGDLASFQKSSKAPVRFSALSLLKETQSVLIV
jgi:hypothetical protein